MAASLIAAGRAGVLAMSLVRSNAGNILRLFVTNSRPTKCKGQSPNEYVQLTRANRSQ